MRFTATSIGFLFSTLLILTSCGLTPRTQEQNRAELNDLKGPDVGSIETTLKAQAEGAVNTGNYAGASETYRQMVDKYPNNVDYATAFADSLRRAGDVADALTQADKILIKHPQNASALETKGLCHMEKGDFTEAGRIFGEVMKVDDKRWRTLNGIGILFAMKNKYDDSIAYYQASLAQSPDNPSVLNNLGLTLAMDKQYDKSFETFANAKQHLPAGSPDIKHVDLNLALVYAIDGKLDEAEQTATPYLSKAALYNNMGFYAYLAKNTDLSKSYLNMALTQSTVYYERAWRNLGAISGDDSSDANGGPGDSAPPATPENIAKPPAKKPHPKPKVVKPAVDQGIPLKDIPAAPVAASPPSPAVLETPVDQVPQAASNPSAQQ